ncbi:MAG TPA: hypothetical protein VHK65_11875 [Candidatus Dormibacteraeota bacterium]|nr:hypothetical protein [Candidatus Dormibacteraeota bacterium]
MKGAFDVVLYSPAEQLERHAWVDRVLRTLERLAVLTGNRPFTGYRGNREVTVEHKRSAIEELIEANLNREGGQVFAELGSIFGVGITFPGGDPEVADVTASFRVGNTKPRFHNGVIVEFVRGITPAQAKEFFESIKPIWKPYWGCIASDENADARLDDDLMYEQRLHWYTCYGPDRVRDLDFAVLERDPQAVVERQADGGVVVMLGAQWQSAEKLLEAQRRLEPLFFRSAPGAAGRR